LIDFLKIKRIFDLNNNGDKNEKNKENLFNIIKTQKPPKISFIKRPWSLNIKGQKL